MTETTRHFDDNAADDEGLGLRFRMKYHMPSPKANRMSSQPTSIGAGGYVKHAFAVKVTRRRYVMCPVMVHASRDASLYFVYSLT